MDPSRKTATVGADPATIRRPQAAWLVPAALIFLSLIPVIFGSPVPVLIHIPSVTVYCLLGAFQFVPSRRRGSRGKRSWHRIAGGVLIPAGLLAALSGLWMAVFYALPATDGEILLVLRLVFGSAMVVSIVLGLLAIGRRDFVRHSAWMTRGYAIGVAAGTQALVQIPWILLIGPADQLTKAVFMGASWVLNLAVAEYVIHRRSQRSARASRTSDRSVEPHAAASR
ncbi:DUF2306 domain-containing protein [Pseudarthrobacter albicanus]|uniref:DUF2306 domain-containing protein n=1 Tax=Pseudarthrobacter albicanus TaxID=2823873 RepID=UPI0027DB80F9|nr:DUF2306 domain-containing protein [Pseudarthrobacter albicanus]